MENWQKTYIKKNLPVLIEITKCSAGLKARLKAKELLTNEEDERLTALGRNEGSISEAKMLYEIIETKPLGYDGIIEVLHDTRQKGASKILQDGLQRTKLQEASCDSAGQLMNMRVQFGNCTKSFNGVFPNLTRQDVTDLLQNDELKQELEEIFRKGSLDIKLDGELPVPSELYIPRQLSNRLQLDPLVFTLDLCEDVFVFTNISRMELAQLVKPFAVRSSTNQRSLVTGRHIYLDDEEDWDDMVAISKLPIHHITKEDNGYILKRTTRVTNVLQNYGLRQGRSKEAFVTEDAFVEELVSDNVSKGALICDVAGMGKTCLMQSLAGKLRNKNEKIVVFYIDLHSFSKLLTARDHKLPGNQALVVVLNYACNSKLASHLLQKSAVQNVLKIVFVMDGYDELNREDIEVVKSNLEALSKLDHVKIIVSARPIMRAFLQKSFNLISYDILPFQTDEQVRCLTEHWANVCPQTNSTSCKLKEFALQCIKSVKSIQNEEFHDFLGVPLKCRILATVNEQQAKQLCKVSRQKPLQIVEAATIKSVFDLYQMFVDVLIDKVAKTMPKNCNRNDFVSGVVTFYTHMALELLFPDLSNVYLKNCQIDRSMEEFFRRVGVACFNNVNQRLEFIHRSFAEYFVGRFFADFWNDIEQFAPSFVHIVGSYLIRNVMIAVDGAFKIQPDPSDLSHGCWLLIKYEPWSDSIFSPFWCFSYYLKSKVFHLKYPLILLFMNMNLKVKKLTVVRLERATNRFRNVVMSFETEAITTTQGLQPVDRNTNYCNELTALKKWMEKSSIATMMGCIDERLTEILSLYVQILISFFGPEDRVALLLPNAKDPKRVSAESAAVLLCSAAISKSPENAHELFNLFGDSEENYFTELCQRYPEEYWSPLEVAIITEDLDMIHYFVDKVCLPFYRLFFTCVAVDKKLAEPVVEAKLQIMKIILGSSDRVLHFLCMDILCIDRKPGLKITKYSFQLLLKFLEDSKRSMSSINSENKIWILENCLNESNDEELVNLLLSLYGKTDDKKLSIVNLGAGRTFTAEVVLDALDLVEIRKAFSKVQLSRYAFKNCLKLETLKVLTAIQPDFSCCNYEKWNYLHLAASNLNIDWVKHLISSRYEVDQLDKQGFTPLLRTSFDVTDNLRSFLALAVTRLLVENGANIYVKYSIGQNIAHKVFYQCRYVESKDLCLVRLVSYFLEGGYYQLFEMRDWDGKTPQDILIDYAGKDSPITTDILRLLENYSVASTK